MKDEMNTKQKIEFENINKFRLSKGNKALSVEEYFKMKSNEMLDKERKDIFQKDLVNALKYNLQTREIIKGIIQGIEGEIK